MFEKNSPGSISQVATCDAVENVQRIHRLISLHIIGWRNTVHHLRHPLCFHNRFPFRPAEPAKRESLSRQCLYKILIFLFEMEAANSVPRKMLISCKIITFSTRRPNKEQQNAVYSDLLAIVILCWQWGIDTVRYTPYACRVLCQLSDENQYKRRKW